MNKLLDVTSMRLPKIFIQSDRPTIVVDPNLLD
jgi:hypothetical protein